MRIEVRSNGSNGFAKNLVSFFKTARHLWGRCPECQAMFRLSDVAITSTSEEPKDWLRQLKKGQADLAERSFSLDEREADINNHDEDVTDREHDVRAREVRIERDSSERVRQILRSKTEIQALIRQASKEAVQRSRQTLIGRMLERIAPCFRRFPHDPRDMRAICDPMDFVSFDGLTVERHVREITFIEVKCGRSRLTGVQKSIREAAESGRVRTEVWEIGNRDFPITKQLDGRARRLLPE